MTLDKQDGEARDVPVSFETLVTGYSFVEALRVDGGNTVYFSNLMEGGYFRKSPGREVETLLPGRRWIGGAVLNEDRRIILSGEGGIVSLDPDTGSLRTIVSELNGIAIDAVNDMEADDDGGIYAGTVDFPAILDRGEKGQPGALIYITPSGGVEIIREGVAVSNGMGFSPDRRVFYHSDYSVGVWAYDYEPNKRPKNPRLIAELDDSDGLVVDSEGGIWVARCMAAEVVRFLPSGKVDRVVKLPFEYVISLAFGGSDLKKLYVSTGGTNAAGEVIGGVIVIDCDVPGQPMSNAKLRL